MCSIYGCLGKGFDTLEPVFPNTLRHRGPDDHGVYRNEARELLLGHTRLSIIDLSHGAHQPMISADERFVLVFNGEIYNYPELKEELIGAGYKFRTQSDTEVVLQSYIAWGEKCVRRFRGMFSFCIYDTAQEHLFLARDRFGIKPLLYSFVNGRFVFASELKPMLRAGLVPPEISPTAVSDYFTYGAVHQPGTIARDVFSLMPGRSMTVKMDRRHSIRRYYTLSEAAGRVLPYSSYNEARERVRRALEEATQYHMVADVEVGAFLSGGVDSAAVVAMMTRGGGKPVNTFSVGFKNRTDVLDEAAAAEETARFLGCRHHNIIIDDNYVMTAYPEFLAALDQPSVDGFNTYIVSRETAKDMKVALSGLGGDELFAGYRHFPKIMAGVRHHPHAPVTVLARALHKLRPSRMTQRFIYAGMTIEAAVDWERRFNRRIDQVLRGDFHHRRTAAAPSLSPAQRISRQEIEGYMRDTLLRDCDVLSMSHSLEVRPVLLDHPLAEAAFALPDSMKLNGGVLKSVLKDSVRDLLPDTIWQRKKAGFELPFPRWLNGCFNSRFQELLRDKPAACLLSARYRKNIVDRARRRTLTRRDWLDFVFFDWLRSSGLSV